MSRHTPHEASTREVKGLIFLELGIALTTEEVKAMHRIATYKAAYKRIKEKARKERRRNA